MAHFPILCVQYTGILILCETDLIIKISTWIISREMTYKEIVTFEQSKSLLVHTDLGGEEGRGGRWISNHGPSNKRLRGCQTPTLAKQNKEDVGLAYVIERYDNTGVLVMIIWFICVHRIHINFQRSSFSIMLTLAAVQSLKIVPTSKIHIKPCLNLST